MDNVQNCDGYIYMPSSHIYRSYDMEPEFLYQGESSNTNVILEVLFGECLRWKYTVQ
jgi:hypothetical protein